jgi:hypothetical protein
MYKVKLRAVRFSRRQTTHTICKAIPTSGKTPAVSLFSSIFLATVSSRQAIYSA